MHNEGSKQTDGGLFIVSGASSGIGYAIARRLVDQGRRVIGLGRNRGALDQAAQEMNPGFEGHVLDLLNDESILSLVHERLGAERELSGLIHSAGLFAAGSIGSTPPAVLDETLAVNFRAPFLLTSLLVSRLAAARGTVVFVNSSAGLRAAEGHAVYCASKFALRALAEVSRLELNKLGVRVASIFPGRTATPLMERFYAQQDQRYDASLLLQPDDVAAAIMAIINAPEHAEITDIQLRPREQSY